MQKPSRVGKLQCLAIQEDRRMKKKKNLCLECGNVIKDKGFEGFCKKCCLANTIEELEKEAKNE